MIDIQTLTEKEREQLARRIQRLHRSIVPRAVQLLLQKKNWSQVPRRSAVSAYRAARRALGLVGQAQSLAQVSAALLDARRYGEIEFADDAFQFVLHRLADRRLAGRLPAEDLPLARQVLETYAEEMRQLYEEHLQVRRDLGEID